MSVHFEALVDVSNKRQRRPERHAAQHQREDERRQQRVAKELCTLDQAAHRRPISVVKNRVDKDKEAGGARAQHAPPPPAVVLAWQQEVSKSHRDASTHGEEDGEDAQQDAIESVVLSAPNCGKNVVQLHRDGTEEEVEENKSDLSQLITINQDKRKLVANGKVQTYLNGRKPPMAMCTAVCLYQGCGGICRAMLRVRHGAWKCPARFFPTMPPMTVSGKPTRIQVPSRRSTVVAGRAWVEPLNQWTEFTTLHVRKRGAVRGKKKEIFEDAWKHLKNLRTK